MAAILKPAAKAHWNEQETNSLVNYLHEHQAEGGDGGNFKTLTYTV
jgi:hypothetical protein